MFGVSDLLLSETAERLGNLRMVSGGTRIDDKERERGGDEAIRERS